MIDDYLKKVSDLIENKHCKKSIVAELESHILDETDYYIELGYTQEEAYKKAIENMGNPEDVAVQLNELHKVSWYKNPLSFMSAFLQIFLLIIVFAALPNFVYSNNMVSHSILFDYTALSIFIVHLFFLYYARKLKNKFIAITTCSCIILEQIITFLYGEALSLYQPIMFSVVTIFSKGFIGYRNSLFSQQHQGNDSEKLGMNIASYALSILLVMWVIIVLLEIIGHEKLKPTKKEKIVLNITEKFFSIFIAVDFMIMAGATISAFSDITKNTVQLIERKNELMEYVINANVSLPKNEQIEKMKTYGYDIHHFKHSDKNDRSSYYEFDLYNYYGNVLTLVSYNCDNDNLNNDDYTITYKNTYSFLYDIPEKISKKNIESIDKNITLDEFINTGNYTFAISISHFRTIENTLSDKVSLKYNLEDGTTCEIRFKDNKLYDILYE